MVACNMRTIARSASLACHKGRHCGLKAINQQRPHRLYQFKAK